MRVLPYASALLMTNVGRLEWREGGRIARDCLQTVLGLWILSLVAMVALS